MNPIQLSGKRVAVVGSGIAGLGAAWALAGRHEVTLFESDERLGGHAHTVHVPDGGRDVPVDTGFIVYNERNYPNLTRLFAATGTPTEGSDMSFAVSMGGGEFEYRGSARGILAQPSNLLRSDYRRMILDILRFNREARDILADGTTQAIGEYLEDNGYSDGFTEDFLLPMIGCIWSSKLEAMRSYPAATLVRFLDNHGLLRLGARPSWRTVTGGSRAYVDRVIRDFGGSVRLDTPVRGIVRDELGVTVATDGGHEMFDEVVFATHADTTLAILGPQATPEERSILGAFRFQRNLAVLHRDPTLMPARRGVWSSWNYLSEDRGPERGSERVSLTYWMNRLQNLTTERPVFVTLNPSREPRDIVGSYDYEHPVFDQAAVSAQHRLAEIQGVDRTWFAGAWTGYGFHEDGLRSGLAVATALGSPAPWSHESPVLPADRGEGRARSRRPAPQVA